MSKAIHFISGLPRSGTTLLAAILRQNPGFHAAMSSPVAALFGAMQTVMSGRSEFHSFIDDGKRVRVMRGLFENYYESQDNHQVIFDTNRSWSSKIPALRKIFPECRFILCVRSVVDVLNSIEKITQKSPLEPSKMFNYSTKGTIYDRADQLLAPKGLIGQSYNGLKEAFYGEASDALIVLPYESLVERPAEAIGALYAFLGLDPFDHDFENLSYRADEFDRALGTPDLHTVRSKVGIEASPMLLPPDLAARYVGSEFWRNSAANPNAVRII